MPNCSTQNPWPGLRAFTENDHDFFFGRERETAELLDLVQRCTVIVLYGQSGLGKTSMLQAGLFPGLKGLDFLPLRVRFDHSDEAPELAQQIKNELAAHLDRMQIAGPRPGPKETLWEFFHRRDLDFWGPRNRLLTPVVVFDQFEEVFTLGQRSEQTGARVARFAQELEAVLEHRPPQAVRERLDANPDEALHYDLHSEGVKFIVSLREDFLADLDPWRARMPSLLPNRFRLERMTGAQALDVVQRGGRDLVDAEVAHGIVDFVSKSQRAHSVRSMEQRDVEPALLSVVCDELNRRRVDAGKAQITADFLSHEREEIIQSFYERAFDDIDPRVRDWVEDRLLTASGYRNRAALEDALKEGLPAAAFDQLVNRRILHREERSGVVWLELTHDLLSDPASRSRTAREQRRLAEEASRQKAEAAEREAQLRSQLSKSRRRTTVYGVLLVGTAAALALAIVSWRSDIASRKKAKGAEQGRTQIYQTAAEMAERMSFGIGGENWVPAATVIHKIEDAKKAYENLLQESSPDKRKGMEQEHAHVLAKAADSLFQIGHFEDGLKDAEAALDILEHANEGQQTGDTARLSLAEAYYEKGTGLLATGQLSAAQSSFENALKAAKSIPDSEAKLDFTRIYVLSELGLGELELERLKLPDADAIYRSTYEFVNRYGSDAEEVVSWKVLTLEGRGRSQWNEDAAGEYYAKAAELLGTPSSSSNPRSLTARSPRDLRWKMMVADLTFRQGWALRRLGQYQDAAKIFEDSVAVETDLCKRDCPSALDSQARLAGEKDEENWLWRMLLLQGLNGLGQAHSLQSEWNSAEALLQQASNVAHELTERQPSWTRAAYLHVMTEVALGEMKSGKYKQNAQPPTGLSIAFNSEKDPKLFIEADRHFQEAQDIVKTGYATSENREFVRMGYLALWNQGSLRVTKADACRRSDADFCVGGNGEKKTKEQMPAAADQLDKDALDKYSAAMAQEQPIAEMEKKNSEIVSDQAYLYSAEGEALNDLKRYDDAKAAYGNCINHLKQLTRLESMVDSYRRLAWAHIWLGDIYLANDPKAAHAEFESAMAAIDKALSYDLKDRRAGFLGIKALIYEEFADLLKKQGDLKGSLAELEKALTTDWKGLNVDYADASLNQNLRIGRTGTGSSLDTLEAAIKTPTGDSAPGQKLTAEQSAALLKQIADLRQEYDPAKLLDHYGQSAGALHPILPGAWSALAGADLETAREQIVAAAPKLKSKIHGIRALPLDFYQHGVLYEANVELENGTKGVVEYVRRENDAMLLKGSTDDILRMNEKSPPLLDTPNRASAYLRFILGQMHSDNLARLQWIDQAEDVNWLPTATADDRSNFSVKIKPLIVEHSRNNNGEWQAIGSAVWGGRLDLVSVHLSRDGNVSLGQEQLATKDLPILVDTFSDGIRIQTTAKVLQEEKNQRDLAEAQQKLKENPGDLATLKQLVKLYAEMKRWKDGEVAQKEVVSQVQREDSQKKDHAANLRQAYFGLWYFQIFARNFSGALASAEAVTKLDPADLLGDETRAAALLLMGHTAEAEEIYLRNVGKKVGDDEWSESVSGDFRTAESEGLTNPEFQHIRDLMNLELTQQRLKANPNDLALLQRLPLDYSSLKRWDEAVEAGKKAIALALREPHDDAKQKRALVSGYLSLSWCQLFTRDFAGALASAETGEKFDKGNLFLETNRAHALLFLGRTQEAEDIYVGNRGKKLDPQQDDIWDEAVLKDFNDLEAGGLKSPEIARLRKLLAPEQK